MSKAMDALREEHGNMARLLRFLEGQIDVFGRADEPGQKHACKKC